MLFASFYTHHGQYPRLAGELAASLKAFNLSHRVVECPDIGDWKTTVRRKAKFIRDLIIETQDRVVWIDCDCVAVRKPSLLLDADPKYDFAVYNWLECPEHKLSFSVATKTVISGGVMMWGNTPAALEILDDWTDIQNCMGSLDDPTLDAILTEYNPLTPLWLPASYNRMTHYFTHIDPVIDHRITGGRYRDGRCPYL